jgi:mannose-6-phosphate isomerase-like protein (cupin superfamily)
VSTTSFAQWPPRLRAELDELTDNPRVGTRLLLEDEHTRLWEIRLAPGERIPFHRHVLDYVWVCVSGGTAVSRDGDGAIHDIRYGVGETRRLSFAAGESMIHDLENTGSEDLVFTTFEYLASANAALALPDDAPAR